MKIDETFARLRQRRETALIPYVTGGYPTLDDSMEHLGVMASHGADLLEVGVPFSDPIADGPTIQHASETALAEGVTLDGILTALGQVKIEQPIVLMSYLNPLLAYGRNRLFSAVQKARISGVIVPDLPVEEADDWRLAAQAADVSLIGLAAPTSTDERIRAIVRQCSGFLYCVSLTGTTGMRADLAPELDGWLARIKRYTDLPLAVGFGISKPEHIRALYGKADGVIVGSRIIDAIRRGEDLAGLIQTLKEATRSTTHVDLDANQRDR
ncbi:MAG: tryptophan synthase subunit alpha [Planctomycetes bacterium]|nr:tryptophan synthase subunit alpha [Planctomycetota bacterium]